MMRFYGYYNERVRTRVKMNKAKCMHFQFVHDNNEEDQGEPSKGKIRKHQK